MKTFIYTLVTGLMFVGQQASADPPQWGARCTSSFNLGLNQTLDGIHVLALHQIEGGNQEMPCPGETEVGVLVPAKELANLIPLGFEAVRFDPLTRTGRAH
jgi:hypothetical protein